MKKILSLVLVALLFTACSISPKKIEYGKDMCSFCDMTIVEKTHAAQYVTKKGKAYKFDAIECMLNDLKDKNVNEMAFILVTDYGNPTVLIDAEAATYLISEEIKSPMGANLSAFKDKGQIKNKGTHYNWNTIRAYFTKK
ncbi:MAG: nitrous oxide reductase accessory protein NosL [Flavobacteriaceae bacterium]|nr:nitrous oxide reductase accessory protein NosL [Flavobacteriaceae bacterium]